MWNECDPEFVDHHGDGCDWYARQGCSSGFPNSKFLGYASWTPSQGLKSGLLCPVCGCSTETGPISFYDNEQDTQWIDAFGPSIEELRNNPKED